MVFEIGYSVFDVRCYFALNNTEQGTPNDEFRRFNILHENSHSLVF
jgi:hypothetical protein